MNDLVVVDHYYDRLRDMYVLVLGVEDVRLAPVLDEQGNHLREPDEVYTDPETGEERTVPGEPRYEEQPVLVPVEDIAFSGSDPKWKGKAKDDIVREQKRVARATFRKREADADAAQARLERLPGVGESL